MAEAKVCVFADTRDNRQQLSLSQVVLRMLRILSFADRFHRNWLDAPAMEEKESSMKWRRNRSHLAKANTMRDGWGTACLPFYRHGQSSVRDDGSLISLMLRALK